MSAKMRLAVVYWGDAHASTDFEDNDDLNEVHVAKEVASCGWVWKRDATGITLVACVGEEDYDRRLFIPVGMIRKVHYMRSHSK